MPLNIEIPFFAFEIRLETGGVIHVPLNHPEISRVNDSLHLLAGKFAESLQSQQLNKGDFFQILRENNSEAYLQSELEVDFPASKDGVAFPAFTIKIPFYYSTTEKGIWGIIPYLGLEAFSEDLPALTALLSSTLKLEFAREDRLKWTQKLLEIFWFKRVDLVQHEINLRFPKPNEVENLTLEKEREWLPRVASMIHAGPRLYGQDVLFEQFISAVKNKFNSNVLLVGASGVGKTATIFELVRRKEEIELDVEIWETTASSLIKELTEDQGWKENMSQLCKELSEKENQILFVRNLLDLFEVGQYQGSNISLAEFMTTWLARSAFPFITECTEEAYSIIELKLPNFLQLFQVIRITEPKIKLEHIVEHRMNDIAKAQKISIKDGAVKESIRLFKRFTPYAGFPGKPIRFLESILIDWNQKTDSIGETEVINQFCEESGIPRFMVDSKIPIDLEKIQASFDQQLFGQSAATASVIDLIATIKTALTRPGKPIASLLFVGPTGVGKTEMAKILAAFMFGDRNRMVRFDMSEYSDFSAAARLTGHGNSDGLLTSAVQKEPFSVLLFDEIEKADASFYDLLLSILGEGRLTNKRGKVINFCSSIIIMTSNIGARKMQQNKVSFVDDANSEDVKNRYVSEVQKHFRPELYNRIDRIIPFASLDQSVIRNVLNREWELLKNKEGIKFRNIEIHVSDEVLSFLGKKGFDQKYGARYLQRCIRKELIIPLSKKLNLYDYDDRLDVHLTMLEQKINIEIDADDMSFNLIVQKASLNAQANVSSILRRNVSRMLNGHNFNRMRSEITRLEHSKKRLKDEFWNDESKGKMYTLYLDCLEKAEVLKTRIESIEEAYCRTSMGLIKEEESLEKQMNDWKVDFKNFKLYLLGLVNPNSSKCYLHVYGDKSEALFDFYKTILENQGYEFEFETIWYRQEHYAQMTANEPDKSPYVFLKPVKNKPLFKPEKGEDMSFGFSLKIQGPGAMIFIQAERGGQKWYLSDKEINTYFIEISNEPIVLLQQIHRKNFYEKMSIRRTIKKNSIKDTDYKINREVQNIKQLCVLIEAHLSKTFDSKLNDAVY